MNKMASDEKILDKLHFLSWKIETLESKLETSLALQEDLAASFLQDEDAARASVLNKLDRVHVSGSRRSDWNIYNDDVINSSHYNGTSPEQSGNELERSTTYLIIPVGSYKNNDLRSSQKEKQTFTWFEVDHNAPNSVTRGGPLKSGKEDALEILECVDANYRDANIPVVSDKLNSFANQSSLQKHRGLGFDDKQMSTQWNLHDSDPIGLEDCLPRTGGSGVESFEKERKSRSALDDSIIISENMSIVNAEVAGPSRCKYGLTIGLATAKPGPSYSIAANYNECVSDRFIGFDDEDYGTVETRFENGKCVERETSIEQCGPLSMEDATIQLKYSPDEVVFDQLYKHSSTPQYYDNGDREGFVERLGVFSPKTDLCCIETGNQPPSRMIEVHSDVSQHDQANCIFVDTYGPDLLTIERSEGSLHANPRDAQAFVQTFPATEPDEKQAKLDYHELEKNSTNEKYVYLTERIEAAWNGNNRFKQFEVNNYDASDLSKKFIDMQIDNIAEGQRTEDDYCTREGFRAGNSLTNNAGFKRVNGQDPGVQILNDLENVNKCRKTLWEANRTNPSNQESDGRVLQRSDYVYEKDSVNDDIKAIKKGYEGRTRVKTRRKSSSTGPRHALNVHNTSFPPGRQPLHLQELTPASRHKRSQEHRSIDFTKERAFSKSSIRGQRTFANALAESGFSESLVSSAQSDEVFFASPNQAEQPDSHYGARGSVKNRIAKCEGSESDSPYSSLTSVSSTIEPNLPWPSTADAVVRPNQHTSIRRVSRTRVLNLENAIPSSSTASYANNNESPSSVENSETLLRSFRLSSLPRPAMSDTLHNKLLSDILPPGNSSRLVRVSSPTSSVDTSELSMSDTVCECQYQCECQTGIPSVEDFREELKTISRYVLNARQKSSSVFIRPQQRYYLDEEQGEVEILDGRLQRKENQAVPMLVKVILRLRKHFFGSMESKTLVSATLKQSDENNNEPETYHEPKDNSTGKPRRGRKISFSPSAMLLSAIGENSAAEVKAVIEKENIDVNQLSPSGRSLLHKAAAAGDLESIHTLVQYGALVNIADQDGFPPIDSALRKAHFKCAILLIEYGSDVARYTAARIREFLDISEMRSGHMPLLLKTNL